MDENAPQPWFRADLREMSRDELSYLEDACWRKIYEASVGARRPALGNAILSLMAIEWVRGARARQLEYFGD